MGVTFRIILLNPTEGVEFGLQKGSGNNYETIQKQVAEKGNLHFDFTAEVRMGKDGTYSFYGPFVQGPPAVRFVYIDIGTAAGQRSSAWSRRLKIPLTDISKELLKEVLNGSDILLETTVPGIGRDGGPNCGTVKPFNGWHQIAKGTK